MNEPPTQKIKPRYECDCGRKFIGLACYQAHDCELDKQAEPAQGGTDVTLLQEQAMNESAELDVINEVRSALTSGHELKRSAVAGLLKAYDISRAECHQAPLVCNRNAKIAIDATNDLREANKRIVKSRICYRGYGYGMGSQDGIDDLRRAIMENGHE